MRPRATLFGLLALFVAGAAACDKPPSPSEAREWSPQDHDRVEENARAAQGQAMGGGSAPTQGSGARPPMQMPTGKEAEELVEQLWTQVCSGCHGDRGQGNGPNAASLGPDVHLPDMTDPAWQTKTPDADIATVIKNGKGKMPGFRFPDPFVQGLTKKIRAFKKP